MKTPTKILALGTLLVLAAPAAAGQEFSSRSQDKRETQEKREKAAEPAKPVTTEAEARVVAEKAAQFEKAYRDRKARIDRLQAIYEKKGDRERLAEVMAMREQLEKRHANAMENFRKQLGQGRWAKVEEHFKRKGPSQRALDVRNERANENAAEREARKAQKEKKP